MLASLALVPLRRLCRVRFLLRLRGLLGLLFPPNLVNLVQGQVWVE
jgi:hypothetical protein